MSGGHEKKEGCLISTLKILVWLLIAVVLCIIIGVLLLKVAPPPGASHAQRIAMAPPGTLTESQENLLPEVVCEGRETIAATIGPGESVLMPTLDQGFGFSPDTSEGTMTVCNAATPSQCSSVRRPLRGNFDRLLVTNISDSPVEFRCWYR